MSVKERRINKYLDQFHSAAAVQSLSQRASEGARREEEEEEEEEGGRDERETTPQTHTHTRK